VALGARFHSGLSCIGCRALAASETRRSFAKTRTPPKGASAGGVSGTLRCGRYEGLSYEGSASQTRGRAKSSSRNVRRGKHTGHTFLEASGALTDWTPRAGVGCPRSLAHLAARCWACRAVLDRASRKAPLGRRGLGLGELTSSDVVSAWCGLSSTDQGPPSGVHKIYTRTRKSSAGQTNIGAAVSIYRPQFRFTVPNSSIA
jgi:hypothetical protein